MSASTDPTTCTTCPKLAEARAEVELHESTIAGLRYWMDNSKIGQALSERDAAIACCDSYAEENQRLSDERDAAIARAERAEAERDQSRAAHAATEKNACDMASMASHERARADAFEKAGTRVARAADTAEASLRGLRERVALAVKPLRKVVSELRDWTLENGDPTKRELLAADIVEPVANALSALVDGKNLAATQEDKTNAE